MPGAGNSYPARSIRSGRDVAPLARGKTMSKTFTLFTDPGHGWLNVTVADCLDVGLMPRDFSRYSYRRAEKLYLEEDCDASKFIAAYVAKHGAMPTIKESHTNRDSIIRTQARIA